MGLRAHSMISNLQGKLKGLGEQSMIMMNNTQAKLKEMGADEMISNLQEKLTGIGKESKVMMNNTQAKLKEMGADEMISNLKEKLTGIEEESMIMMNNTQAKLKEMGADEMINNLQEKLKELWLILENFGLFLIGWLDKVFPPETRKERIQHWLHVSAAFVVTGLVFLVLFWCCRSCIRCCWMCCTRCIRCCWWCCSCCIRCCYNKAEKMMKAPGRNFVMPRHVFESNPTGYFRSLRADKLKYR